VFGVYLLSFGFFIEVLARNRASQLVDPLSLLFEYFVVAFHQEKLS